MISYGVILHDAKFAEKQDIVLWSILSREAANIDFQVFGKTWQKIIARTFSIGGMQNTENIEAKNAS